MISAVKDFEARQAVGIEKQPELVQQSREKASAAGVSDRVKFIEGDLFASDFEDADVITLFLGHQANIRLRSKIINGLKPGSRIVSHQFNMGEWKPDKELTVRTVFMGMWGEMHNQYGSNSSVPDYSDNEMHFGTSDKVLVWIVPAPVAGIWDGKIETTDGTKKVEIEIYQCFSTLNAFLKIEGRETKNKEQLRTDLWGDHIRYMLVPKN